VKWKPDADKSHLQDRRGQRSTRSAGRGVPMTGKIGLPALLIILAITFFGGGDGINLDTLPQANQSAAPQTPIDPNNDPDADSMEFTNTVFNDVQDLWAQLYADADAQYPYATLVLFTGNTSSACGGASSAIGPHYCPLDNNVYIDLEFFDQLTERFGAPGDFAQAYVISHEVAHHVQTVAGINGQVRELQQANPSEANGLSVLMELQADCFAGIWARATFDQLEPGDIEEALGAAAAVGDDRIQEAATGRVDPEGWTHGSAAQRMFWFQRGMDSGDPSQCDTFSEGA